MRPPAPRVRRASIVLPLLVVLATGLLAGCLGGDAPTTGPSADGGNGTDDGIDSSGPVPQTDGDAAPTLEAAPAWAPGDWWRVRLTDRFNGDAYEATRVMAGTDGDGNHLVGMPADDFVAEIMVLHVPGFGEVAPDTLGFEIHDCPFEPLRFPLEDGAEWQTEFECRPVNATVAVQSDTVAEVTLTGQNDNMVLTYDAEVGAITEMDIDAYALVEVVDAGTDHEGTVEVPSQHDLVFLNGRFAGVVDTSLEPAAPVETVGVADRYDRVDFILGTGPILPGVPNGVYHERATAPDGTVYEMTTTPADPAEFRFEFFTNDAPSGDWELVHIAAGPGAAFIEGIGYTVLSFELPAGASATAAGTTEG